MRILHDTRPQGGTLAFAASCLLLLVFLAFWGPIATTRPVSFDGAMNLQVSEAIASEGEYARYYQGDRPFPHEVQTNAPLTVPAAAVIGVAGVGPWQTQIVNFAYVAAFLFLLMSIVHRQLGWAWPALAAFAAIVTPGFLDHGMNGWGEVIALFWWLAGTVLLLRDDNQWKPGRSAYLGALCLGLALATKTILLIGIAATLGIYALRALGKLLDQPAPRQLLGPAARLVRSGLCVACWVALPLVVMEAWKFIALDGLQGYTTWWQVQGSAIFNQTGVGAAEAVPLSDKLQQHFQVLASITGVPGIQLAAYLLVPPLVALPLALESRPLGTLRQRLFSALLLVAVVYIVWWLALSPSTHTRLRRVLNGLVAMQLAWIFCLPWLLGAWKRIETVSLRWAAAGAAFACLLLFAWTNIGFGAVLARDLAAARDADTRPFFGFVGEVRALDKDKVLFAKGFLSAPQVSLYAGRRLHDIDLYTARELRGLGTGYLVIDPSAARARRFSPELRRYESEVVARASAFSLVHIDFSRVKSPFSRSQLDSPELASWVDFLEAPYPFTFGMHAPSAKGWRWASTDAELLLAYDGQDAVVAELYQEPRPSYARNHPFRLQFAIDGCHIGTRELVRGMNRLTLPIPEDCRPADGPARLSILADNMIPIEFLNRRQMSYVVNSIGFQSTGEDPDA